MSNLSPQAQTVWEAFNEDEVGVFVDYGQKLAAALRAIADQVVLPKYQYAEWELAHAICEEIFAIADEMEGSND